MAEKPTPWNMDPFPVLDLPTKPQPVEYRSPPPAISGTRGDPLSDPYFTEESSAADRQAAEHAAKKYQPQRAYYNRKDVVEGREDAANVLSAVVKGSGEGGTGQATANMVIENKFLPFLINKVGRNFELPQVADEMLAKVAANGIAGLDMFAARAAAAGIPAVMIYFGLKGALEASSENKKKREAQRDRERRSSAGWMQNP